MKRFHKLVLAIISVAILSSVGYAQSQEDERVVIGTNLVSVNVSVTDEHGRYVAGLRREDFEIIDDQVRRQIAHFSSQEAPFSLGIVYDMHGPTAERADAVLRALKQFAGTLRAGDDFFFLTFNERGSFTVDFVPSAGQISNHLVAGGRNSPTSLYDAVHMAAVKVRAARNAKKALLIVSDGQDHNSRQSYKELRKRLREFDVQLYTIGVADPETDRLAGYGRWVFEDLSGRTGRRTLLMNADASFGRAVLGEMARVSGGAAYFPEANNEPELVGVCTQIGLELRSHYTLGFYATGRASGQGWHRIRINVKPAQTGGRLYLSYREGYQQ